MDEILKGTNSQDRHIGSKALITQLLESKGRGIIATHDLDLHVLEEDYEKNNPELVIKNWNFDVKIDGKDILFDYKLKRGVCTSLNASQLMKNMGININQDNVD